MNKLAILFISVLFLTGCWKDIARDIVLEGLGSLLSANTDEYRKQECDKYGTTYEWENTHSGITRDMVIKENIIYSLKETSYSQYKLTEVNLNTGTTMKSLLFREGDIDEINTTSNTDIDDIILVGNFGISSVILAYNIVEHKVIWLNNNNKINKTMTNGFLYYKDYKLNGSIKENFIAKIDPVSGKSENIYSFPDSLNGMSLSNIEALHSYNDISGNLYFVYAVFLKNYTGEIVININILNFNDKKETTIKSYLENQYANSENVITLDNSSIYLNIEKDVFCYDKLSGDEKWSSYITANQSRTLNSFEVKRDYLISNYSGTIDVKDKITGENIFTMNDLYGNDRTFGVYEDYLYFTDYKYFYQVTTSGEVKSKFTSLAYCDGEHGNIQNFIIDNSGNIILSDNNYILFKSAL